MFSSYSDHFNNKQINNRPYRILQSSFRATLLLEPDTSIQNLFDLMCSNPSLSPVWREFALVIVFSRLFTTSVFAVEITLACRFSNTVQSAPAWVRLSLPDHLCRYCPWLPGNQHAAGAVSQWWISITVLIALHLLSKSAAIETKKNKKKSSSPPPLPTPYPGGRQATAVSRRWRRKYQFWHDAAVEPPLQHKHAIDCEMLLVWTTTTTATKTKGGQDITLKAAAAWSWHMLASVGISHRRFSFTMIDPAVAAMMNEKLKLISEGYY